MMAEGKGQKVEKFNCLLPSAFVKAIAITQNLLIFLLYLSDGRYGITQRSI